MTAEMIDATTAQCFLHLALTRYERMAQPPRHLQEPLVADLEAARRARMRAACEGDADAHAELSELVEREVVRQTRLSTWPLMGRSALAWRTTADRLEAATTACARLELLSAAAERSCRARVAAARNQAHRVETSLRALGMRLLGET